MLNKIKFYINTFLNFLHDSLWSEKQQWILWIPVLFGFGIWLSICREVFVHWNPLITNLIVLIIIGRFLYRREWYTSSIIALLFSIVVGGFVWAQAYTVLKDSPKITEKTDTLEVFGKLDDIQYYRKKTDNIRFVVEVESIKEEKFKYKQWQAAGKPKDKSEYLYYKEYQKELPHKVRLNIRTETNDAEIGDIIRIKVKLMPNPTPVYPGAYDFAKNMYYKRIDGVGYAVSDVEILQQKEGFLHVGKKKLDNLRLNIANRIRASIDYPASGVAVALLTGVRGMVERESVDDMRFSGLAHLLAISGLHLGIVVGLFFFVSRYLFACNEYWALHYNIKKWSAWIGLVVGFLYLTLTNYPVSATRAYIMAAVMLFSIILDRDLSPLRSVAIAAMIIMLIDPAVLMSAGFHMSFSAVIGLISGFALVKSWGVKVHTHKRWLKIPIYAMNIMIASIIAEFAIAPFSIYHFNNYTQYGIFANLFAMPLTSFIIMPFGVISLILMPMGLEKIALVPMSWGIENVLKIADYTVNLPYAVHIISEIQLISICLIVVGGLWFWLWQEKWRYLGVVVVLTGVVFALFRQTPNLIIDPQSKTFALLDDKGQLYLHKPLRSDFKESIWLLRTGNKESKQLSEHPNYKNFKCYKSYCYLPIKGRDVYIAFNGYGMQKGCEKGGDENVVIVDARDKVYQGDDETCKDMQIFSKNHQNDIFTVYLSKDIKVKILHTE